MSKHTPGPWRVASAAACAEIPVMEIAEVSHMRVIPDGIAWPNPGTPEDDARLIAAAPDLLAALNAFMNHMGMDEDEWNRPVFNQAREAVSKATGERT